MKPNIRMGLTAALFSASALIAMAPARAATSIDVSTQTPANWTVTGGGATNATPDVISGSNAAISLTSTGTAAGTPISGFSNSTFDGYWTATDTFTIPAGATDISFTYSGFMADDRAILTLNGTKIASAGTDGPGTGTFVFTDGGNETQTAFANDTSGTITTGLNVGGTNTLTAVINNTTGGIQGTLSPFVGTNGTDFALTGSVMYTAAGTGGGGSSSPAAVPLPPAVWTGLCTIAGLTLLGTIKRRRALDARA